MVMVLVIICQILRMLFFEIVILLNEKQMYDRLFILVYDAVGSNFFSVINGPLLAIDLSIDSKFFFTPDLYMISVKFSFFLVLLSYTLSKIGPRSALRHPLDECRYRYSIFLIHYLTCRG